MKDLLNFLDGKKTYIVAVVLAVLNVLAAQGKISPETIQLLDAVLAPLGLATLRAAVAKNSQV